MINAIFIDPWGWLTLNDSGERRHKEVANLYQILIAERTPIYTSTFVLDETFTLFFKRLNSFQAKQAMLQLSEAFFTKLLDMLKLSLFANLSVKFSIYDSFFTKLSVRFFI